MKSFVILLVFVIGLTLFTGCTNQLPQESKNVTANPTINPIDQNIEGITINPINNKNVGDKFQINGLTNLAEKSELLVEVNSASFNPTSRTTSGVFYGATGTVLVQKGINNAPNSWSFPMDTTTFSPDTYIVLVSAIDSPFNATSSFTLGGVARATQSLSSSPTPIKSSKTQILGKIGPNDDLLIENPSFRTTRDGSTLVYSLNNQGSSKYSGLIIDTKIILTLNNGREEIRYKSNNVDSLGPQQSISNEIPLMTSNEFGAGVQVQPQVVIYKLSGSRDGVPFTTNEDIALKIGV